MPKFHRVKEDEPKMVVDSGKGVPQNILDRLAANKAENLRASGAISKPVRKSETESVDPLAAFFGNNTVAASRTSNFSEFSMKLNLEEYDFPEEDALDPSNSDVHLDVTALDRYNEEIRRFRRALLDECRILPPKGEANRELLDRVRIAASNLCRTCYYGTYKAHSLCDTSVQLLVWLLSRRNFPIVFQMNILQSVSEMIWTSGTLKRSFIRAQGIHVVVRIIKSGMIHHANLACWAIYTLLAAAIGSGEVVAVAQAIPFMDEFVGEMTFPQYWREWPANFGAILQGILFGPHSVSPFVEEEYQFM